MGASYELDSYFGIRVPSGLHQAALTVARQEDRTISSYVRVLIRDDLARRGMLTQDQTGQPARVGVRHDVQ